MLELEAHAHSTRQFAKLPRSLPSHTVRAADCEESENKPQHLCSDRLVAWYDGDLDVPDSQISDLFAPIVPARLLSQYAV